ncbi:hypothetical protein GGI05_003980, partial [Coemansia sp. RSA 2603]
MSNEAASKAAPAIATAAVLVESEQLPKDTKLIKGYDFDNGVDYNALLSSYLTTGFQASSFGRAVEIVNHMRAWRLSDEPLPEDADPEDPENSFESRNNVKCKV